MEFTARNKININIPYFVQQNLISTVFNVCDLYFAHSEIFMLLPMTNGFLFSGSALQFSDLFNGLMHFRFRPHAKP